MSDNEQRARFVVWLKTETVERAAATDVEWREAGPFACWSGCWQTVCREWEAWQAAESRALERAAEEGAAAVLGAGEWFGMNNDECVANVVRERIRALAKPEAEAEDEKGGAR